MNETFENKPLMNSDEIDLMKVLQKIWDGRKTIFKWMGIFFIIGIIIAIGSPKEYKSEVTLLVESGSSAMGMSGFLQQFGGLAGINLGGVSGEETLTPKLYPDIIKSTPFLLEIMDQKVTESKFDSTLRVQDYLDRHTRPGIGSFIAGYTIGLPAKLVGLIRVKSKNQISGLKNQESSPLRLTSEQISIAGALAQRIQAKQGESANTLLISAEMQDPKVAALLVDSVVRSLTVYVIDYRTQKAKTDLKFVEERHAEAEAKYRIAQKNLADYKDRNKNVILASVQSSEQNLQGEYNLAFNVYNTLSQQLEQAKMKVQEKTPVFKVVEPAKVPLQKSKPRTSLILVGMIFIGAFVGITKLFLQSNKNFRQNDINKIK